MNNKRLGRLKKHSPLEFVFLREPQSPKNNRKNNRVDNQP